MERDCAEMICGGGAGVGGTVDVLKRNVICGLLSVSDP